MKSAVKKYFLQIWIAFDQLCATFLGAWADETLSSYAFRLWNKGNPWGAMWKWIIDWLALKIFKQPDHCVETYQAERKRAETAPEKR